MSLTLANCRLVDPTSMNPAIDVLYDIRIVGSSIEAIRPAGVRSHVSLVGDAASRVVDLRGRYVVPGLVNLHSHLVLDASTDPFGSLAASSMSRLVLDSARRLEECIVQGVVTLRDVGSTRGVDIELAELVDAGRISGPQIFAAGSAITMTGGHGALLGVEVDGIAECRRAARRVIKSGASTVKVIATGGIMGSRGRPGAVQLSVSEMAAVVEEAHNSGLVVAAHAESADGIRNAIEAGVDSVEHGHGLTEELAESMAEKGVVLVPTLLADTLICERGVDAGIDPALVERTHAMLETLLSAFDVALRCGTTIGAGNDGGTPFVHQGDVVSELQIYCEMGMSSRAALASATSVASRLLGLEAQAVIKEGSDATLLVLDRDPTDEIGALRNPTGVMRRGRWYVRPEGVSPIDGAAE